jgi:caffeoyl-CoA O-methyltransferase
MFHGEVLQPIEEQGKSAKHIQAFNDHVNATDRVSKVMLPVRDGITIIKKIK